VSLRLEQVSPYINKKDVNNSEALFAINFERAGHYIIPGATSVTVYAPMSKTIRWKYPCKTGKMKEVVALRVQEVDTQEKFCLEQTFELHCNRSLDASLIQHHHLRGDHMGIISPEQAIKVCAMADPDEFDDCVFDVLANDSIEIADIY